MLNFFTIKMIQKL